MTWVTRVRLLAFIGAFEETRNKYEKLIEKRKRWIVKLKETGMTTREIQRTLDCKASVVNNALTQAGYTWNGKGWYKVE